MKGSETEVDEKDKCWNCGKDMGEMRFCWQCGQTEMEKHVKKATEMRTEKIINFIKKYESLFGRQYEYDNFMEELKQKFVKGGKE